MEKKIRITYKNYDSIEFDKGTTLKEISKKFKKYFNYPILVAKIDNDIIPLSESITKSSRVDFYDRSSYTGNTTYSRSLQFILILAVKRLFGSEVGVVIEHSMDKGFYCEINGIEIDKPAIDKISVMMHQIVKDDLTFMKVSVSRIDAIRYFKMKKQMDKVNVLKYISNTYINLYRIDDIYDYFYGDLAYSTKDIDDFKLTYIADNGFVVSYPDIYNPECTLDYVHHKKIFDKFLDYTKWGRTMEISNSADLNKIVSKGKYDDLIRLSEAHYDSQLSNIAEAINEDRKNIKLVLIAGPSSSGKTTTSKKLEVYLKSKGLHTHQISTDDYFKDRKDTPLNAKGEPDFECVEAIDLELFNKHLVKLLEGEKVLLPEYNFILGKKEYKKKWLQIKENDIIVIEGLHSLNDNLTLAVERKNKYKIYLSPLTQLNIDNHNRIHTSDTRKLRRIARDNKYRGHSASETLKLWENISYGEQKYIFPYQDDNDVVINSALLYEIGVLKTYVEPLLFSVDEDDDSYPEALRLINFLRNFLTIPSDSVPSDSVLREFIGGSCFTENDK